MLNDEIIAQEKEHLKAVYKKLIKEIENIKLKMKELSNFLSEQVVTSNEDYYAMDDEEKAETKTVYDNMEYALLKFNEKLNLIQKLENSCYFGSFLFNSATEINNIYLGITGFIDENNQPLVCDWRAPICSIYYDYEIGDAKYLVIDKEISGSVLQKRQYKVKKDNLIYAIDSAITISDEILKEELSKNKTDKMKNIVATIQKEQNAIIRHNFNKNILIQGCAGSGKTSIALHRVAYLLYTFRNEIKAENVLVISPSQQFSKYIENVLPELSENSINSRTFLDFAKEELRHLESANNLFERLQKADDEELKDYNYKNSFDFLEELKIFLQESQNIFVAKDFVLGSDKVSKEIIENLYYDAFKNQIPSERINNICLYICDELNIPEVAFTRVKNQLFNYYENFNIYSFYEKFIKNNQKIIKKCEINANFIKYEDIAPLLLIKKYFYGINLIKEINLIIIDEYENYSACEFEYFKQIFDGKFLIVGDNNQAIFKNVDSNFIRNLSKMFEAETISLNKSYRATKQISIFNNNLKNLNNEYVERNGDEVEILRNLGNDFYQVLIKTINDNNFSTKAVVCKNNEICEEIFKNLKEKVNCCLNNFENDKVLIASADFVQGLEFDLVIIPDYEKYVSKTDINALYNITTRATNKLVLLSR